MSNNQDQYNLGILKLRIQEEYNKFQKALSQHSSGQANRHRASDIELSSGDTIQKEIDNITTARFGSFVSSLRSSVGTAGEIRYLKGYSSSGDGGEGLFVWDDAAGIDDGGTRLNVGGLGSNSTGWLRIYEGARNILWFGAAGDGITDDRQAIIRAHESLRYTGGALFFPTGVYRISAGICWTAANAGEYDNITWFGEGRTSQIKVDPGAIAQPSGGVGVLSFRGAAGTTYSLKGLTLRDLRITGTSEAAGGSGVDCTLIHFDETDGVKCVNLYLDDHPREGIHFGDARRNKNAWIDGCYATRIGGYGASIGQYTSAYNPNCDNVTMTGCVAYQCGCAVEFTGRSGVFTGNIFDDIGWTGGSGFTRGSPALMQSNLIGFTDTSDRVVVANNTIRMSGAAISLNTSSTISITGNTIDKCDSGILIGDSVIAGVISGNTLYDTISGSQGAAIKIGSNGSSTGSVLITGNTIVAGSVPWAYGVDIQDNTAPYIVRNNAFVGECCTTRGVRVVANNTKAQILDNEWLTGSWVVYGAFVFYEWRGAFLTYNAGISGITSGIRLTTEQPSILRANVAPAIGTWNVGDRCINTLPSAGGILEWICTVAGTPGTWVPVMRTKFSVPFLFADASVGISTGTMPNSEQPLANLDMYGATGIDLSGCTECRLHATIVSPSSSANNPRLYLSWSSNDSGYANADANGNTISLSTSGRFVTAWGSLAVGARINNCYIRISQNGGDSSQTATLSHVWAEFR